MFAEKLQSRLQNFVLAENKVKWLFKEKLDRVRYIEKWTARTDAASALWRSDSSVIVGLDDIKAVSNEINQNFLSYRLSEILKLFYFILGIHEEMYHHIENNHPLINLIKRPIGYSFNNTSSYVLNRFEELLNGKDVWVNNKRIELCTSYLL